MKKQTFFSVLSVIALSLITSCTTNSGNYSYYVPEGTCPLEYTGTWMVTERTIYTSGTDTTLHYDGDIIMALNENGVGLSQTGIPFEWKVDDERRFWMKTSYWFNTMKTVSISPAVWIFEERLSTSVYSSNTMVKVVQPNPVEYTGTWQVANARRTQGEVSDSFDWDNNSVTVTDKWDSKTMVLNADGSCKSLDDKICYWLLAGKNLWVYTSTWSNFRIVTGNVPDNELWTIYKDGEYTYRFKFTKL